MKQGNNKTVKIPGKDHDNEDYSCGSSPTENQFKVSMKQLKSSNNRKEIRERLLYLWGITYKKAKGAAVIVRKQFE